MLQAHCSDCRVGTSFKTADNASALLLCPLNTCADEISVHMSEAPVGDAKPGECAGWDEGDRPGERSLDLGVVAFAAWPRHPLHPATCREASPLSSPSRMLGANRVLALRRSGTFVW